MQPLHFATSMKYTHTVCSINCPVYFRYLATCSNLKALSLDMTSPSPAAGSFSVGEVGESNSFAGMFSVTRLAVSRNNDTAFGFMD